MLKALTKRRENCPECHSERKLLKFLGHKEFCFKNLFLTPGKFVHRVSKRYIWFLQATKEYTPPFLSAAINRYKAYGNKGENKEERNPDNAGLLKWL